MPSRDEREREKERKRKRESETSLLCVFLGGSYHCNQICLTQLHLSAD
jgi:hypothetical protein